MAVQIDTFTVHIKDEVHVKLNHVLLKKKSNTARRHDSGHNDY